MSRVCVRVCLCVCVFVLDIVFTRLKSAVHGPNGAEAEEDGEVGLAVVHHAGVVVLESVERHRAGPLSRKPNVVSGKELECNTCIYVRRCISDCSERSRKERYHLPDK